jgi:hypothetical protein
MAFDFPSSPTVGQQFSPVPGVTYSWNGYAWAVAAAPPPGAVQIRRIDVTSPVASVDFTLGIDATYDEYELHVINYQHSIADQVPLMRVSTDGGATWKQGATDYQYTGINMYMATTGNGYFTSGGGLPYGVISGAPQSTSANLGLNSIVRFRKPTSAFMKSFDFVASGHHTVNGIYTSNGTFLYAVAEVINGIRVLSQSGNITSGTFILYGIKSSVAPALVAPGTLIVVDRKVISLPVSEVAFVTGIGATYDEYEIHFFGLETAVNGNLSMQISQDGGVTWKGGSTDYTWQNVFIPNPSSAAAFSAASSPAMVLGQHDAGVSNLAAGTIKFYTPSVTTFRKPFIYEMFHVATTFASTRGSSIYSADNNAINGVRFYNGGGNMNKGTFILYGRAK